MKARPKNPWHDYTIWQIAQLLGSYRTLVDVEMNPGQKHGSDIVASRRDLEDVHVNIEVQMHPSGKEFPQIVKNWWDRHQAAKATFIVCPAALRSTMMNRVLKVEPRFSEERSIFFFGDDQIEQLCATVFSILSRI